MLKLGYLRKQVVKSAQRKDSDEAGRATRESQT